MLSSDQMLRQYGGEADAIPLVQWLNTGQGSRREQVAAIIEAITANRRGAGDDLNRLLASYRFIPEGKHVDKSWTITWKADSVPQHESTAVVALLVLLNQRNLHRIRRCSRCSSWFFARFPHQTYCGNECQQAAYRDSDEFRQLRRDYMQQYRAKARQAAKKSVRTRKKQ